jgi:hypothetical protein
VQARTNTYSQKRIHTLSAQEKVLAGLSNDSQYERALQSLLLVAQYHQTSMMQVGLHSSHALKSCISCVCVCVCVCSTAHTRLLCSTWTPCCHTCLRPYISYVYCVGAFTPVLTQCTYSRLCSCSLNPHLISPNPHYLAARRVGLLSCSKCVYVCHQPLLCASINPHPHPCRPSPLGGKAFWTP